MLLYRDYCQEIRKCSLHEAGQYGIQDCLWGIDQSKKWHSLAVQYNFINQIPFFANVFLNNDQTIMLKVRLL